MGKFRRIPGYWNYGVTKDGVVKSMERDLILKQYMLNGYKIVDTFRGSLTETLPVHRAVALAWVENTTPETRKMVNHIDGDPLNNWYRNLEWCTVSENNYHAVNNGLRKDNLKCRIRDFFTGEIKSFHSVSQAALHMKTSNAAANLNPRSFGALIKGRYEFRLDSDDSPWFYEHRKTLVNPSQYMVVVTDLDGTTKEFFFGKELLKEYQLYKAPCKSVPALVEYAQKLYPEKKFELYDAYSEDYYWQTTPVVKQKRLTIIARKDGFSMVFNSLRSCARDFDVDRSSILNRLNNGKELDGWTFITLASSSSNV